jgi:hypothetical protein
MMGMLFRMFAPKPLKQARRAAHLTHTNEGASDA